MKCATFGHDSPFAQRRRPLPRPLKDDPAVRSRGIHFWAISVGERLLVTVARCEATIPLTAQHGCQGDAPWQPCAPSVLDRSQQSSRNRIFAGLGSLRTR